MTRTRKLTLALLLGLLVAGAVPGSARSGRVPEGPEASVVEGGSLAVQPVAEASREAVARGTETFSGGPAGTVLLGAALASAVALLLAVVFPW